MVISRKNFFNMADDIESEVGDATEITDESFPKELVPTAVVQNDEVFSQVSENIDTQSVQEVEKTQECSETEVVSQVEYSIFLYSTFILRYFLLAFYILV